MKHENEKITSMTISLINVTYVLPNMLGVDEVALSGEPKIQLASEVLI